MSSVFEIPGRLRRRVFVASNPSGSVGHRVGRREAIESSLDAPSLFFYGGGGLIYRYRLLISRRGPTENNSSQLSDENEHYIFGRGRVFV